MGNAGLRRTLCLACTLLFVLLAGTLGFAADPEAPQPQFRTHSDLPLFVVPAIRPLEPAAQKPKRVADTKFIAINVLAMALTIADIESTQHCLSNSTCQELNPMMPHSRLGMYAVNIPINTAAMYISYKLKASGHKTWWIAPLAVSGAHGVGAGFVF